MLTAQREILARVTARGSTAEHAWGRGRPWSCHCLLGHGEGAGCAQPATGSPHLRPPAVGVRHKGEKHIHEAAGLKMLEEMLFRPPAPQLCPLPYLIPGDALPQHLQLMLSTARHHKAFLTPSLHHFRWKRNLVFDVLPICAFSSHKHHTDLLNFWSSLYFPSCRTASSSSSSVH